MHTKHTPQPAAMGWKREYAVAIAFTLTSTFFFALMTALVRLSGDLPTLQKAFFRNLISAGVAAWALWRDGGGFAVQRRNLLPLGARALSGTISLVACYYTFDAMHISDATMLAKIAPFCTLVFSALLMRERVRGFEWAALVAVFAASCLVIKPGFAGVMPVAALIGALGGMCSGMSVTMVRYLQLRGERSASIVLAFSAFSCLLFLPFVLLRYAPMTSAQFWCLMGAGSCATVGQFAMSAAYKRAPAGVLSVFEFAQILFTAIFGMVWFAQYPDALSVLGYLLVTAVAVWLAYFERKTAKNA